MCPRSRRYTRRATAQATRLPLLCDSVILQTGHIAPEQARERLVGALEPRVGGAQGLFDGFVIAPDAAFECTEGEVRDRPRGEPLLPELGRAKIFTGEHPAIEQRPAAFPVVARLVGRGVFRNEHEIFDQRAVVRLRHHHHHVDVVRAGDDEGPR